MCSKGNGAGGSWRGNLYKTSQCSAGVHWRVLVSFKELVVGPGTPVTEVPVIQAWGLAFRSSEPVLNLGVMESICNPNAREEEIGRSLKFIGLPGWISELQAQWESLSQKIKVESDWGTTLDIDICPPHTCEHMFLDVSLDTTHAG